MECKGGNAIVAQTVDRYALEQYLEIEDTLGYRSEFHDGTILIVKAATPTHASLEARIIFV